MRALSLVTLLLGSTAAAEPPPSPTLSDSDDPAAQPSPPSPTPSRAGEPPESSPGSSRVAPAPTLVAPPTPEELHRSDAARRDRRSQLVTGGAITVAASALVAVGAGFVVAARNLHCGEYELFCGWNETMGALTGLVTGVPSLLAGVALLIVGATAQTPAVFAVAPTPTGAVASFALSF